MSRTTEKSTVTLGRESRNLGLLNWAIVLGVPSIFAIWIYRVTPGRMGLPWALHGDLLTVYALAQSQYHGIFDIKNEVFGAPFFGDFRFAYFDYLSAAPIILLRMMTDNPFLSVNLFYLLTFPLASCFFCLAAKKLGTTRWIASLLSIGYSLLPYHFYRFQQGHVQLSGYYLLPIGVVSIIGLLGKVNPEQAKEPFKAKFRFVRLFLLNVLVGSAVAYYSVFLFVVSFCLLGFAFLSKRRPTVGNSMKAMFASLGFLAIPFLLRILAPATESSFSRFPDESLTWGGLLTRLIFPWSPLTPGRIQSLTFPLVGEFEWVGVSLLSWIGGLLLIAHLRFPIRNHASATKLIASLKILVIAVLFYMTGGLGYAFSLLITPEIRCWNRLSILIETVSLLSLGILFSEFSLLWIRARKTIFLILLIGVSSQAINLDYLGATKLPTLDTKIEYIQLKQFSDVLQENIQPGCSILQLPTMLFPEGGNVNGVPSGDHLRLGLMNSNFKWSYGASKLNNEGLFWLDHQNEEMPKAIQLGFCAVVIDTRSNLDLSEYGVYVNENSPFFDLLIFQ